MSFNEKKLDFWITHNLNVLFVGKHGVGKTSMVVDAFTRAGLNWRYFSASTMDPWVDFVGVPKSVTDKNGHEYLELVRPREFQDDEVEALFFDEYNRAAKKVRNAVMELIQFKSINGRRFKRLKLIWAAVNPDDDDNEKYDVEALDAAQEDRFHIHVEIPYVPSKPYFTDKYGNTLARAAVSWWNGISQEQKDAISPRRLDYALDIFKLGGDMRDVLPKTANVSELITVLESGPIADNLDLFIASKDHAAAATWLATENNAHAAIPYIVKNKDFMVFFLPDLTDERLSALIAENDEVLAHATKNMEHPKFRSVLRLIVSAKQNQAAIAKITAALKKHHKAEHLFALAPNNPDKPHFRGAANPQYYRSVLTKAKTEVAQQKTTYYRKMHYQSICDSIPERLTISDAEETLDFINDFCHRSQAKTVSGATNIIGIINHCIQRITSEASGPRTGMAFWRNYRKRYGHLFEWVVNDPKICERVLNP